MFVQQCSLMARACLPELNEGNFGGGVVTPDDRTAYGFKVAFRLGENFFRFFDFVHFLRPLQVPKRFFMRRVWPGHCVSLVLPSFAPPIYEKPLPGIRSFRC
jgi:hypothetical protein